MKSLQTLWCLFVRKGHWFRLCDAMSAKQCAYCGNLTESYGRTDNYLD